MWTVESLHGATCYLDSNVLIYGFEGQLSALRRDIGSILRHMHLGHCRGCTSLITRAEVLVFPLRHARLELADR